MKNMISYLIVVFSLFGFQLAYAQDCETAGEVTLSELKYVGTDLKPLLKSNACTVVKASDDTTARLKCGQNGQKRAALNPGNPQYTGTDKHGSPTGNNLGYYFCVVMNKSDMCDARIAALGSTMDIKWQQTGSSSRNDGNCVCRRKGDTSTRMMTCPTTEEQVDALKDGNSTGCTIKDAVKNKDTNVCVCLHNQNIEPKKDGDCPTEPPRQVTETVDDNDFEECFADIKMAKTACSEQGKAAIDKCSKEAPEVNKNVQEAQRVMSIGLDALVAKNAGTGALEACAKMGAAGTGLIEALSLLRENCKKEVSSCKKGCDDVKAYGQKDTTEMMNACKAKFEAKYANAVPKKDWGDAHTARFTVLAEEYKKGVQNAEKLCTGDAQVANSDLNSFINDLAASVQKADICKCQLTTGSVNTGTTKQDTCESVMTPLTCMQNLNQPGCSFSSVGCSPGSTVAGCRNPVTAINPNGSGVAMPASGFAGPGFGSSGSGLNAGKVNVGDSDFGGLYDETRPGGSATTTADNGSPFGAASTNGGTSGGAPPSGGDGSGNGSDKEGEGEKSGLAGFFQNAKGGIASLFGGGPNEKGNAVKKPGNKAFKNDVNGFRPKGNVRGMANASEVGGKNRDIWKTMNERYTDQYHTFITVENPSK